MSQAHAGDGPRLRDLSEEELLARIFPHFAQGEDVLVPPGDDAAVVRAASGSVVATTDTMVLGHDWRDEWSAPAEVGAKLVTQNVADLAAMGARPTGLLVTLAAHRDLPESWAVEFARGVGSQAERYAVSVVGGDLSGAPDGVVMVSITALGDLEGRDPVLRSGARVGDVLAVHGSLGRSGAGWWLLEQGEGLEPGTGASRLVRDHLVPTTDVGAGRDAAAAGATAMMDVSDGLVRDAGRIARASGVRIDLGRAGLLDVVAGLAASIPLDVAWQQVLTGGEEHSLIATFPPGAAAVSPDEAGPVRWRPIGRVVEADDALPRVTLDGVAVQGQGFDHFAG
ncbi:thiamine-phosphate kinase [Arsenicicoccus sp. MKL-02]|uniref:Thiamine-monophosphate kinase n=1 Tax=Arsenicicoccus cauae TaxID=2663847 RepID=A0A6I3I7L1_9MICO|nr:thiamine-phosphate kinase [Arsenicicoccus cauae]MTB72144.1 thiamine-phosphate kinase [Arsenicicoccus cauae]